MAAATRIGDRDTGHDACSSRALSSGSSNVFINKKAAGRVGDSYPSHSCDVHPPHGGVIASGSSSVFVNGRRLGRIGDAVSCGGSVAQGSADVFVGG